MSEPSFRNKFQYYIALVNRKGFAAIGGLTFKSQALLALIRLIAHLKLTPKEIQVDGEGNLNTPIASNYFTSVGVKLTTVEADHHYRNSKVEKKHDVIKTMARTSLERSGLSLAFWYFAVQQAVLVSNVILPARDEDGKELGITIWQHQYGTDPDVERMILGPFGALAYLILSAEQRMARGLCKHFGVRAIAGVYLGTQVDVNGVYRHLVCDGVNIFSSPNMIRVVPDVYPMRLQKVENGIPRPIGVAEDEDEQEVNLGTFYLAWREAKAEKERELQEEQLYAVRNKEIKLAKTRLIGDERRTGKPKARVGRIVSDNVNGDTVSERLEFNKEDIDADITMEDPKDYGVIEPAKPELRFVKPYDGAPYDLAVAVDFSNEDLVAKETEHSHKRFVGRRVRKRFETGNGKLPKSFEGVVKSFSEDRSLFKVIFSDGDHEDMDMEELSDHLIMSTKYGDAKEDEGMTRAERIEMLTSKVLFGYWAEELIHHRVPEKETWKKLPNKAEKSFSIDKTREVIYDDEPRFPAEVLRHPEVKEIQEASRAEMQQLVDMDVGDEISEAQIQELRRTKVKILRSKMVYKRKYQVCAEDGREYFKKWKARLAVIGSSEREGIDTLWSTFSPTVGFTAIRVVIALVANPKFITESYDLSGAFLGTDLRDSAVYIQLPPDAGKHAGKVLLLKRAVYGTKASGRRFIDALAERILSFEYVKKPDGAGKGKSQARGGNESEQTRGRFRRLRMDLCIFVYEDSDGNVMYLVHYVDDIILASTSVRIRDAFIVHLNEAWNVTLEGKMERFLGIHFSQEEKTGKWKATMAMYIDRIAKRFKLEETRIVETPLEAGFVLSAQDFEIDPSEEMISEYRSLIGSIGYAAVALRYDICYAVSVLSRHLARPCVKAVQAAKRVVRYLVQTRDFAVEWWIDRKDIDAGCANVVFGSADSSFGMCPITRRSHSGYANFLNNGIISFKSKLQKSVTVSSAEAELMGLSDEVMEVIYLRGLLKEIGFEQKGATLIWEDNKAAILIAEAECSSAGRTKHVDIRFRFIAERIKRGEVRVRYRPTDLNYSDLFTKALTPLKHKKMLEMCQGYKTEPGLLIQGAMDKDEKDDDKDMEASFIFIEDESGWP